MDYTPAQLIPAVLAVVRETGMSAHPARGQRTSVPVDAIALGFGANPVELQQAVTEYADHQDAGRKKVELPDGTLGFLGGQDGYGNTQIFVPGESERILREGEFTTL